MKRHLRIRERRRVVWNFDDSRGEFEKIHQVKVSWEVEELGGEVIKTFSSFGLAEKWAKQSGKLVEVW